MPPSDCRARLAAIDDRHALAPFSPARPPPTEIPKTNNATDTKKHLFPIPSLFFLLAILFIGRLTEYLFLSLRPLTRDGPWAGLSHTLLIHVPLPVFIAPGN